MIRFFKKVRRFWKSCFSWDDFFRLSWGQEGEDLVLLRLFPKKSGFYIDIGAHHPKRFSNTYLFYQKGWNGINIDAKPGSMKLFQKVRSRDVNLEIPIAQEYKKLTYFEFEEPALNTFSKDLLIERKVKPIREIKLDCYPLSEILDKHLNSRQEIDFMSIDVEGLDLEVLKSNNWEKYRPKIVLVEILKSSLQQVQKTAVYRFLKEQNYDIYAKSVNTVFFIREDFWKTINQ
ncbi:FkbM family methyltransferase [Synechococcus sp. BDU 130192]|uniref:FkbM family methyltransferase n=1 Tax=Synechococcus sp. BDU 130192 TaxID=2042059 RepID=UPI000C07E918|nr:FkbM family methyltransferase [Synechococcus sp. BDU 130192]